MFKLKYFRSVLQYLRSQKMQTKQINPRKEKILNTVFACLLMLTLLVFAGIPAMEQAQALKQITSTVP